MKKLVALVGRPNVGKSTLFNRLAINKKAIVHDQPGVTRDRKYAEAIIGDLEFTIIDTPGLEEAENEQLEYRMMQQTIIAIQEADLVCLLIDSKLGVTPLDRFFAELIRKNSKKQILIANKSEKKFVLEQAYYKLGFNQPIPISAAHGQGLADLYEAICQQLASDDEPIVESKINLKKKKADQELQIIVAGRPNAGKSTLINSIIGSQRLLTGSEAGITRESIDIKWEHKGQKMQLIDTAGLRKRANISHSLEKNSASATINSIKFAHIVILLVDASMALEQQDLVIANHVIEEGRGLIIAVNKWDLIKDKKNYRQEFEYKLTTHLPQIRGILVTYLSAAKNYNVHKLLDQATSLYQLWNKKISTAKLNEWLNFALERHPLPIHKKLGRRVRIKYITQTKIRPPTFKLFTTDPTAITDTYRKYLTNSLRDDFQLEGAPLRLQFVKTNNPYANKKRS